MFHRTAGKCFVLGIFAATLFLVLPRAIARQPKAVNLTDFSEEAKTIPKPREIWPRLKKETVIPLEFKILSDEIVTSDTDPSQKLRKVTAHFWSQKIDNVKWGHDCVILMPADNRRNESPGRKGKVVIAGVPNHRGYFSSHVDKLGDPIATRTGYPTMILANPGNFEDGRYVESNMGVLNRLQRDTDRGYYNMNCQCAVVYIKAMDAFQEFLGVDSLQAVIGGHSKRGRSTPVAAAMDSRVAGAIIMGNEGVYVPGHKHPNLSFYHPFFQEQVKVPVFYLGSTNEDGYKMFNVNLLQKQLKRPMTVELIPNYCHSNFNEKQYMDFMMWVSHIFDKRPISRISDVTYERKIDRTIFRAKVMSKAKIQMVHAWYAYSDNPAWRDLMWYHLLMEKKGDHHEAVLRGNIPDAFMIEVGDTALGIPGYVSSVAHKLTDVPVVERVSRGSRPRLWKP